MPVKGNRMGEIRMVLLRTWHATALAGLALLTTGCHAPERLQHREARPLMGTLVEITAEGPDAAALRRATDAAYREMTRLSDMMNHYDPASVASAVNRAAGVRPVAVPPELMAVLRMAQAVSARTHGAFDITVGSLTGWRFRPDDPRRPAPAQVAAQLPNVDWRRLRLDARAGTAFLARRGARIDLGGIAKLYILDAGMRTLAAHDIGHAMLNGGGDVVVMGTTQGRPWRIGIRDPRAQQRLLGAVEATSGFVVSSGDYERYFVMDGKRYHHILDPRTGWPAQGPRHVTLVADTLERVNGYGTAIMVLGTAAGKKLIADTPELEGLIVDTDGSLWTSPGLAGRFTPAARGD